MGHLLNARLANHGVDLLCQLRPLQPPGLPHKAQIVPGGFVHIERRLLRKIANTLLGCLRLLKNIMAVDFDAALRGGQAAGHDIHGGGLSRTIGSKEAVDVAFLDGEGKIVHRQMIPILFGQVFNGYHRKPPLVFPAVTQRHPAVTGSPPDANWLYGMCSTLTQL